MTTCVGRGPVPAERYAKEIGLVSELFPVEPFKFCKPSLRLTYAEGCQLLADYTLTESDIARGCTPQSPEEDLSTPNEKLLEDQHIDRNDQWRAAVYVGRWIGRGWGTDCCFDVGH